MTFWEHLESLRWVFLRSAAVIMLLAVMICPFVSFIFDNIVLAPTSPDFLVYGLFAFLGSDTLISADFNLVNLQLSSQFFTSVSLSFWAAVIVSIPYVLFEFWRFVAPALYASEKHRLRVAVFVGSGLFYLGCCVGYFLIFPLTLRFLLSYSLSENIVNQLSLQSYLDNFMLIVCAMGLMFELPLASIVMSKLGLINRSFFRRYRRHAIVVILVVSAIITPTVDPFTLFAVFLPVYLLWEASAFVISK